MIKKATRIPGYVAGIENQPVVVGFAVYKKPTRLRFLQKKTVSCGAMRAWQAELHERINE